MVIYYNNRVVQPSVPSIFRAFSSLQKEVLFLWVYVLWVFCVMESYSAQSQCDLTVSPLCLSVVFLRALHVIAGVRIFLLLFIAE